MNTESNQDLARKLLEYRDNLFAYIMAMVRDWNTAEDLFQDVSLVILRKDKEDIVIDNFGAWSREIARRTVLNYWKTRKQHAPLDESLLDSLSHVFADNENDSAPRLTQLMERLTTCMERLPAKFREMIDLRYRQDMAFSRIGRAIGKSAAAAQVMMSRIRMRLLDCVQRLQET